MSGLNGGYYKEEEKRRAKALKESQEELLAIIGTWSEAKRIEQFFEEVQAHVEPSDADTRNTLQERLRLARRMLAAPSALDAFLSWKAPDER